MPTFHASDASHRGSSHVPLLTLALLVGPLGALPGCAPLGSIEASQESEQHRGGDVAMNADVRAVVEGNTRFALDLYARLGYATSFL